MKWGQQLKENLVATVRKKSLENDFFPGQGKMSGNFDISQGNLEKMGKVREFQNFPLNGMAKAVF